MSPENIRDEVNRGGRLVIYTYCVSIAVMTFKRPTDIRLIKAGQSPAAAAWPYILISLLFGWWGFPWGPIYTIECIYRDLCGGIDVTDEVVRQIAPPSVIATGVPAAPPTLTEAPAKSKGFDWRIAGVMGGAAAAIAVLGVTIYCHQQTQSLTVVLASGLDQSYSVTLNGRNFTLKPHQAEVLHLPEGKFTLLDASGGKVVGGEKTFSLEAPFFSHVSSNYLAVINPDQVAIFANVDVPYYRDGVTPPKDEKASFTLLANEQTYFLTKPDFVIERADDRTSMPSGTTRVVKTRLTLLGDMSLRTTLAMLIENKNYAVAREHLFRQARQRSDETLLAQAVQLLKPEDVRAFFQLRLAERPLLVEWHRYYQNQMDRLFPEYDLAKEYRTYLDADPNNGALIYLLGRQVTDPDEQSAMWKKALAAPTPCYYALGAMGFDAMSDGLFEEALNHYNASRQAGIKSESLNHYRFLLHQALGRTQEILPELAEARKRDPLNLLLADQEMRAAFSIAHDQAAAVKIKDACLAAYKARKTTDQEFADADAYLRASLAYLTGDLAEYTTLLSRFDSSFYHFRCAFCRGQFAEAEKTLTQNPDANAELLLYLLAQRSGDTATADKHFKTAVESFKKMGSDYARLATLLHEEHPDARAVCKLRISIESKRILLTALGVRQPADRTTYFELARKLNFDPDFPYHFLRSVLAQT